MKKRLILIVEVQVVVVHACFMILFDMYGRSIGFVSTVKLSVWIVGGAIFTLMILHYLVCVKILKYKFGKLKAQF
jgi:hypothetical protein